MASFRGQEIRPTPDRVKESLFQIVQPKLYGARVLDLFCGSGALGLECLSRGAKEAVFNDFSKESVALAKRNIATLKEEAKIYGLPFSVCLNTVSGQFTLILCDPPYRERYLSDILKIVKARGLLERGGLVVYESEREECAEEGFVLTDARSYGRTKVFLFGEEE